MKLHFLGTGAGGVLECYNTCFAIENNDEYLLVDGGGGNQIIKQLKLAKINLNSIHNIFITHSHCDHILGVVWVVRFISQLIKNNKGYEGNLNIFGCNHAITTLKTILDLTYPQHEMFKDRIKLIEVKNNQQIEINNLNFRFFDTLAKKVQQFGFILNDKLMFCGDEPLQKENYELAKNKEWLIHEAFCLESDEPIFKAHEKSHSTVVDSSKIAQSVNAKNLILLHSVDHNLENRKILFCKESNTVFKGNVFVPNDFDVIEIY